MEKSYAQQFKEDYLTINPHAPAADILAAWREREERAHAHAQKREREERALALLNDPNATNDAKDVARQILTGEDARNALILSLKCTLYSVISYVLLSCVKQVPRPVSVVSYLMQFIFCRLPL